MSRTIVTLSLLAVLLFIAGEAGPTSAQQRVIERPVARLFDEYGDLRSCDHTARLDNFTIQLQHEPEAYGYVLVYAPESGAKRIHKTIVDYLVNARGISRKRIKTYHAGYNEVLAQPRTQLWVVPEGAEPPKPKKREVNLAAFKGMLAEYPEWDHIEMVEPDLEEDLGAPVGNVTYALFEDVLKAQKHSTAHVVAFNGVLDVPGAWRRVAESTVEQLKRFGFDSSRFKVGYGGKFEQTKVQLWVLPPGEMPPVKDPKSEAAATTAVQLGEFDNGALGDAKNELAIFERLLLVMRENPDMRACLVVKMEVPVPEEVTAELQQQAEPVVPTPDEPADTTKSNEPEPEPADLPKLVEKWKSELAAKHKLPADRIVVLFANAQEYHMPSLEIWIVPPGQPLPNPNHEPVDAEPSDVVQDPKRRP